MGKFMVISRCFVVHENRLVIVKRTPACKHNSGLWECPGGQVENGQDFAYARLREVVEETGFLVEPLSYLSCVDSYTIPDGPHAGVACIRIFNIAQTIGGASQLSDEHEDMALVSYKNLFSYDITPEVKHAALVLKEQLLKHLPE